MVTPDVEYDGFAISFSGSNVRFESNTSVVVEYDGLWTGTIKLPPKFASNVTGMCGNYNNNPSDDLKMANGTDVRGWPNQYSLVGESFKVPTAEKSVETLMKLFICILFMIVIQFALSAFNSVAVVPLSTRTSSYHVHSQSWTSSRVMSTVD